ncbi:MAG: hypothetical protein ACK4Q5_03045 [Saprospiraceae bacterium]
MIVSKVRRAAAPKNVFGEQAVFPTFARTFPNHAHFQHHYQRHYYSSVTLPMSALFGRK